MRLVFRCVVRNGIRRFQIADPSNDPPRLRRLAAHGPGGGRRGDRDRAHLLGQPGAHACLLRGACGRARRLRRDGPALPQGPGRPAHPGRRARAGAALPPRRGRADRRAAQPLHDRARTARLHGGAACGVPGAAHGRRAARARDLESRRRDDAAQPRGGGLLAPARPRGARRGLGALPRARAREGPARRPAAGVRRDVLPPPAGRRHGLDDAPHARRAAPAGAVRPGARGGRPRARRDGLPDHRHAGLADRRDPGRAQRDRRRALVERLGRDGPLLPRALRRPGRAVRAGDRRARALAAARRRAARARAAAPRRGAGAVRQRGSRTRSCCCA